MSDFSINNKIIVVKDKCILSDKHQDNNVTLFAVDNINFNSTSNITNTNIDVIDNMILYSNVCFSLKSNLIIDNFNFNILFVDNNTNVNIEENGCIFDDQNNYNIDNEKNIYETITIKQRWCDSDNFYDSNIISYVINFNILVNNYIYNSMNISKYTFQTYDNFSFFDENVDINSDKYVFIEKSKWQQYVQLTFDDYDINSSIDGKFFMNKIRLSQGNHNIKIKQHNTPKIYQFNIKIISPYTYSENDQTKILTIDYRDLYNSKCYSNYVLQNEQKQRTINNIIIT